MKALIQRVSSASVTVEGGIIGSIARGILLFLGVEKGDDEAQAKQMVDKVLRYRLFPDDSDRMNLSLKDIQGELLVVSQFTLAGDTKKGLRPSFSSAAQPERAEALYQIFVALGQEELGKDRVKTGKFAADMKVSLINDGPVTFLLEN